MTRQVDVLSGQGVLLLNAKNLRFLKSCVDHYPFAAPKSKQQMQEIVQCAIDGIQRRKVQGVGK